jgi:MFS family permease
MLSSEDDSPRSSAASSTLVAPTEPEDPSPTTSEMSSIVADEKISRPTLPGPLPSDISDTSLQQWRRGAGFWRSFIAICIPLLLSALEGSVTNTALPTISDALNLGTNFSWVATAFLLASTVFQPLYSQLGDMWGRKIPLMIAVMVFAIGSAICGGAGSGSALIAGRIVQGLGTGGIDLFAEMILCDLIPLRKRGPYLGLKHFAFAVGTTLGPLLGGVFAEYGWRWCFLINIPVCAIALVVIFYCLQVGGGIQNSEVKFRNEMKKIDYIGSVMLTASIVMILVALSTGGAARPWSHPAVVVPILLGAMGLAMFACWECSAFCKYPIMSPQVFSNRTTNIAFTLTTIHGCK